jgi:hypothetical protein
MQVTQYIRPDSEDKRDDDNEKERSVWVRSEDGSEYDVSVIKTDGEWESGSISNVIVEKDIKRRDGDFRNQLREMAVKAVKSIESINEV